MNNACINSECQVAFVNVYNKNHTYEDSVSGEKPWRKLILIVSVVTRTLASMRILCLVQSRGQSSSSALMIFTFLVCVENS